jgi:Domain of unknown function (DUF4145)
MKAAGRPAHVVAARESSRTLVCGGSASLPDEELPKRVKQAAHEVRHLGNDGAHAEPVSAEEAAAVLTFTKAVLEQLYVLPAQLAASKAGRAAKKGTP